MADQNPLTYSRTKRIVLLVDLSPLLHLHDSTHYLHSILASAKLISSFAPLSHSLYSFKLFFSSLSPLLSSSAVLKLLSRAPRRLSYNPNSLCFDRHVETMVSLSQTLNSLVDLREFAMSDSAVSKAEHTASSMYQLVHDYAWDVEVEQDRLGMSFDSVDLGISSRFVRSNLVILFSPICRSLGGLSEYMGVVSDEDRALSNCDLYRDSFMRIFGHVGGAFSMRDIHFSWVDTSYELDCAALELQSDDSRNSLRLFQLGLKALGWGFSSTGSIVLGSALVPFGLIYPKIGALSNSCDTVDHHKVVGQLSLEILDVKGRPLQCKCCDIQLLGLKALQKQDHVDLLVNWKSLKLGAGDPAQPKTLWEIFGHDKVQVDIRSIHRYDEVKKLQYCSSDVVLVCELSGEPKRSAEDSSADFFPNKVLDILTKEAGKCAKINNIPIWEILLSFLYRGGYWALVNISKSDGSSRQGILKSFNVNSAFLYLMKGNNSTSIWAHDSDCLNGRKPKGEQERSGVAEYTLQSVPREERKRKIRKDSRKYNGLSWGSFCTKALSCSEMELEEAYLSTNVDSSKKLKFLKCWMKQVSRLSYPRHCKPDQPYQHADKEEMLGEKLRMSNEESEQPLCSSFPEAGGLVPNNSHMEQGAHVSSAEASESFFSSLSDRIGHGVESGVDLAAFAHRIVKSSVALLLEKLELPSNEEVQCLSETSDGCNSKGMIAGDLMKILLKAPRDLSGKHKDNEHLSQGDGAIMEASCEQKIREFELQILFRMEILQSDIAAHMKKSTKQKLVKQTCSLLEFVQCNMEGGFFGDFNLNDYVERLIKTRYSETLGDVIQQICEKLDLLLFQDEEDGSPNPLLNSEDSSQSWKERPSRENSTGDHDRTSEPLSSEDPSFPWGTAGFANRNHNREPAGDEHTRMLDEARERRERARRFSSFGRGALDLQRVWAPKQPKLSKSRSCSLSKPSRRKLGRRERQEKVCETPDSGNKRLSPLSNNGSDRSGSSIRTTPPRSVYKALFQDD